MEQPEEQEITMDLLTEDEKAAIDDAPTQLFDFLYNNILEHGHMPEYFLIILVPDADREHPIYHRYEGGKVDAALMYYEYLIENGYRTDSA